MRRADARARISAALWPVSSSHFDSTEQEDHLTRVTLFRAKQQAEYDAVFTEASELQAGAPRDDACPSFLRGVCCSLVVFLHAEYDASKKRLKALERQTSDIKARGVVRRAPRRAELLLKF